jgi:hypothetical protein
MDKYGFSYFTNRVEVLSEGAGRPSPFLALGEAGAKMVKYMEYISTVLKKGGTVEIPDIKTGELIPTDVPGFPGNNQRLRNRYIINAISDFDGISTEGIEVSRNANDRMSRRNDEITNLAMIILGHGGKSREDIGLASQEVYPRAAYKWVKENPEKVTSPEFEKLITDPDNILKFLHTGRTGETGTAKAKEKEVQDIHGISVNELHAIVSKAAPLIAKINKAHGYKYGAPDPSKAFSRPGLEDPHSKDVQQKGGMSLEKMLGNLDVNNNNSDNVYVLSGALKHYGKYIQYFKQIFANEIKKDAYKRYTDPEIKRERAIESVAERLNLNIDKDSGRLLKNPEQTLEPMLRANLKVFKWILDTLRQAQETGTGISLKSFFKFLNVLGNKTLNDEDIQITLGLIKEYLKTVEAFNQQMNKTRKEGEYRGFDPDVVNSIATTPEDKAIFDKWYDVVYYPAEKAKEEKLLAQAYGEISTNLADEKRKFDTFQKHEVNSKGQLVNRQGMYDTSEEKDEQLKAELMAALIDKPMDDWSTFEYMEAKRLGILKALQDGETETVTPDMEDEAIAHLKATNKAAEQNRLKELKAESYVMNYMTEQVSKDRFHPVGEFKDRGFKKMNYDQWLRKNS